MSKRQEGNPLRDRLADFYRAIIPTRQEQLLVAAILLSMLVGAIVMHYRREYRLNHPIEPSPTPRGASQSLTGG
jgi:hypothetical protein